MKRFYTINENNTEVFDKDWFNEAVSNNELITVNSLSGGKTSAYIAANHSADYNVFSLVRTSDKNCKFPDDKVRQIVSDRIGAEFIGTLEEDTIVYTMLDLEQFIGKKINWVTGKPFEDVIKDKSNYLPNLVTRFCTTEMKLKPIFDWWLNEVNEPIKMRIGFRANEQTRAKNMIAKTNELGLSEFKHVIGHSKNGRNKWGVTGWQYPDFPLIKDGIYKDNVEAFWKDKPVRFAYMNNCIGCFHRNEVLLKHMSDRHPEKFQWFIDQENNNNNTFKKGVTYEKIKQSLKQIRLFDDDFNSCDTGSCGI